MIAIVDYGMGNLGSVQNMFKKIGVQSKITNNLEEIHAAPKILLPGVGAFDSAMQKIADAGMRDVLNYKACVQKVPVLGICLGMQLLTNGSDEGVLPGLGWINGRTHAFKNVVGEELKIPHMGWNIANVAQENILTKGLSSGELRFYFVHSYFVKVDQREESMMKTSYGVEFDSGIARDNIFGVQFHPEKSHRFGMNLFLNFSKL